ncbi:BrnT family toxin [Massilia sp. W12]|uniref:BrnT family toxin n=1 Tax=Massilia sp. W12 TaxID=3126507 RepID=UPI0030CAC66F
MDFEFEWDEAKNASNKNKHGVDFMDALRVFYDDMRITVYDDRSDYGEERFQVIGMSYGKILFVVYTERHGNTIRIISARKAEKREAAAYTRGGF